jgi:hypothetical protein
LRLYLDDDVAARLLIELLRQAGHDVWVPIENRTAGLPDAQHFIEAINDARVLLTLNYDDFHDLHQLLQAASGRHPGLVVIRKDNDSARDLTPRGIVNALRKLEQAGQVTEKQYLILNHWR